MIRAAARGDIAAVAAIYAEAVATGTATFEIDPPDDAEMVRRYDQVVAAGLPFLVAGEGDVLGFAYASAFHQRAAFRYTVEDSIYLHADARGRGIGTQLLGALVAAASRCGCRRMIALIGDSANQASIRLHARTGFAPAGCLPAVGWKFGRWLDVVLMQRALGGGSDAPAA